MSAWNYQNEARRHALEFLDLGHERHEGKKLLHSNILASPERIDDYLHENRDAIYRLVEAVPSRRLSMLRRLADGDELTQMALILGSWQHCRKAVLAYEWLMDNDRFIPGSAYRIATASQGRLFDQLKARKWTRWPFQWGKSPFPGEKTRREPYAAPDYDEVIDKYDPASGMY